jgi:hypothetical protein
LRAGIDVPHHAGMAKLVTLGAILLAAVLFGERTKAPAASSVYSPGEVAAQNAAHAVAARRISLASCFDRAEDARWDYVKLNGKLKRGTASTWVAPTHIWDTAARNKANAIEACKALWQ